MRQRLRLRCGVTISAAGAATCPHRFGLTSSRPIRAFRCRFPKTCFPARRGGSPHKTQATREIPGRLVNLQLSATTRVGLPLEADAQSVDERAIVQTVLEIERVLDEAVDEGRRVDEVLHTGL